METQIFLYIPPSYFDAITFVQEYALVFLEKSIEWAKTMSAQYSASICVLYHAQNEKQIKDMKEGMKENKAFYFSSCEMQNAKDFLEALVQEGKNKNAQTLVVGFLCDPFLDVCVSKQVIDLHIRTKAEYTFCEGFPLGFAPFVLDCASASIMVQLQQKNKKNILISQECVFAFIQDDINSFEVETYVSPFDYRMSRLEFCLKDKLHALSCANLFFLAQKNHIPFTANDLSFFAVNTPKVLCTVPSFFDIQITNEKGEDVYSPIPFFQKSQTPKQMKIQDFAPLMKKIADFAGQGNINLCPFGEPLLCEDFLLIAKEVLKYEGFSLVIQTDGISDVTQAIEQLSCYDDKITWLVTAFYEDENLCQKAQSTVALLCASFKNVYPKITRTVETEEHIESFYRFYVNENSVSRGKVLITKFNDFCGVLPDKKPCDLSPLKRFPCYHLMRDMVILACGCVPLCRELGIIETKFNAFDQDLSDIWQQNIDMLEKHVKKEYSGKCENCDEYYTFNL